MKLIQIYIGYLIILIGSNFTNLSAAANPLWKFKTEGSVIGKPLIIKDHILITAGKSLYALDFNGKQRWKKELTGTVSAGITHADKRLYIHSSEGLHALDMDGNELWFYSNIDEGPLVDGRTWGWGNKILPDPWGWYRSSAVVKNDTVFFGSSDGLHAVSTTDGKKKWHVSIGSVTADPIIYKDTVIAGSWNNSLYSLDTQSGKLVWNIQSRIPTGRMLGWIGYLGFNLTPVLREGIKYYGPETFDVLYVGVRGSYFYAIDAKTGVEHWSAKAGSTWIGSPAVLTEDSVYYGLSDGAAVIGHHLSGGDQNLFFKTDSLIFAQPEVYEEQLIVGTLSGHLFKVDTKSGNGEQIAHFGPEEIKYREFFMPKAKNKPEGLNRYESSKWGINQMHTVANSILTMKVHQSIAYIGTGTGTLYAIQL